MEEGDGSNLQVIQDNVERDQIGLGNSIEGVEEQGAFSVLSTSNRYLEKFKLSVKELVIKFSDHFSDDTITNFEQCLHDLIDYLTAGMIAKYNF
jgi:hypothetical protein